MTTNASLREQLCVRLAELGIETRTVEHGAVFTVGESDAMGLKIAGAHTKNLFLKDAKDALFLIVANRETTVDLKAVQKRLGAGRLSFGKPELMRSVLGVEPGSVTAFAIMNDTARQVSLVVDATLLVERELNCHPMENTATTTIARDDLMRFFAECGVEPTVLDLGPIRD